MHRAVQRFAGDAQLEARLKAQPRQIGRRVFHQFLRIRQGSGNRACDPAPLQPRRIALLRRPQQQGRRVMAKAADFAGAERFKLPSLAGLPEVHLRFILRDATDQTHGVRSRFLDAQVLDLACQRMRGGEDLVVEAILPTGIREER